MIWGLNRIVQVGSWTSKTSLLRAGGSRSFFLARGTCDPTIVRWRKAMISLGDEQQASDSRLMLSSLDVETLGPFEKFVGMGKDFFTVNRDHSSVA